MTIPLKPQSQAFHPLADSVSSGTLLLRFSGALVLVLALILVIGWLARRRGWGTSLNRGKNTLHIEQSYSLGQRERLAIVELESRRLLLGITPGSITLLCELEGDSDNNTLQTGTFQQALTHAKEKRKVTS